MIAFEIHTQRDNKWRIMAIYDDLEIAKHEARMTAELGRDQGVLVIEESYDSETNQAVWRTRFRAGKFARRVTGDLATIQRVARRSDTKHRQRQRDRMRDGLPVNERAFKPALFGRYTGFLTIGGIVFGGLAAIYGIRHVASLME